MKDNLLEKPKQHQPIYLYGVSVPLILLLAFVVGGSIYFYSSYKNKVDLSQKNKELQDEVKNRLQDKKEDLTKKVITEEQLNQMIKDQAVGKGIGENTLESATAKIVDDSIFIKGLISDGTKLDTQIGMIPDGQGIFIKELSLTDAGPFVSVKETLLRAFLKATVDGMFKQGEDAGFVSAEIVNNEVIIYFGE
jgi:hypothetical protein